MRRSATAEELVRIRLPLDARRTSLGAMGGAPHRWPRAGSGAASAQVQAVENGRHLRQLLLHVVEGPGRARPLLTGRLCGARRRRRRLRAGERAARLCPHVYR